MGVEHVYVPRSRAQTVRMRQSHTMPKRKNPFGDTAPLQLKTHVGYKEAATEEEKEEVYAKTKALLFQGANPQAWILPRKADSTPVSTPTVAAGQPKNGLLKYFTNGSVPSAGKQTGSGVVCRCCKLRSGTVKSCSYCEQGACEDCLRACCICAQTFCQFCSVLNYDRSEVQAFCLNCLPTHS